MSDSASDDRRALGLALRRLREASGLTQQALAERADSDHTYLSRLEHGRIDVGWSTLQRLLRVLGADLRRLQRAIDEVQTQEPRSKR
jgi:transcriptional regulator with XRE-family HTH domain